MIICAIFQIPWKQAFLEVIFGWVHGTNARQLSVIDINVKVNPKSSML